MPDIQDDYDEPEAERCRDCGAEMEWVDCFQLDCDNGSVDEYDEDPINCAPGTFVACSECHGRGGWWHCRPCYDAAYQREQAKRAAREATAGGPARPATSTGGGPARAERSEP